MARRSRKRGDDISNRTLAVFLVVAIVVSVGGTYFVVNQGIGISGAGTVERGTLNCTVTSVGENMMLLFCDGVLPETNQSIEVFFRASNT